MSSSDSFLPVQGDQAEPSDGPVQPEDYHAEDENEPDVFLSDGSSDEGKPADEPPVVEHSVFRTPTGESADPSDD